MPFGFKCSCQFCVDPTPEFEDALVRYHKLEFLMRDEKTVEKHPAEIYQMAHDVLTRFTGCEVTDMRVVMIWLRCALIAAFNSDLGRAKGFLAKARKMAFILQGPSGLSYSQITKWYDAMQLMPGFAATTRGLSNVIQSSVIYRNPHHSKEVLFMLNARPDEYVRLHRYRRLQDDEAQGGYMLEVLPDEDTKEGCSQMNIQTGHSALIARRVRLNLLPPEGE